jgi:hypothetical protein
LPNPSGNSCNNLTHDAHSLQLCCGEPISTSSLLGQLVDKGIALQIETGKRFAVPQTLDSNIAMTAMCRHPNYPLRVIL